MSTLNLIAIRDGESNGGFYSPAKEKAAIRGPYQNRFILFRRIRQIAKLKLLLLGLCALCGVVWFTYRIPSSFGWNLHSNSSSFSPFRGGYTVLINTWKRNSLLKQSVAHYASCRGTDAIHVVWSENDPPSDSLKDHLKRIVIKAAHKPSFKFDLNEEDNLNNRFKPIKNLRTDAIFSVDDDVLVPCDVLDFAFTVWQTAPSTMVGFVPRMHWLDEKRILNCMEFDFFCNWVMQSFELHVIDDNHNINNPVPVKWGLRKKDAHSTYFYGGWWSVWWMGTYSMVLSKAAFFHKKYLDMYSYQMPASIRDYVTRERNCEDIAMSLLVANATAAPPIWVKGKIYEIGSSGISSLKDHSSKRHKCLNDFVSLYGTLPLVSTNVKAVDSRGEWLW